MRLKKNIFAVSVALLVLTGCYQQPGLTTDNSYNRTKTGAVTGALAGALIGYNTKGHHKGQRALIGGLLGAATGSAIGYSLDEQANTIAHALGTGVNNDPLATLDPNNTLLVSKTPNYVKIMFRDPMMFASNDDKLQGSARYKVTTLAKLLRQYPQTIVGVAGFTDNTGGYAYNKDLSERRARTVANILAVNKYPKIKGCAYAKAIAPNNSAQNKALNRRVEVYLYADARYMSDPCQ